MNPSVACFAKGWRTLSAALAFFAAGLLNIVGSLDMTPVVSFYVSDPKAIGATMVGIGLLFGFLRYIATTPIGSSLESSEMPAKIDEGH